MAETIGQKAPKKIKKSALPVRKAKKSKPAKAWFISYGWWNDGYINPIFIKFPW